MSIGQLTGGLGAAVGLAMGVGRASAPQPRDMRYESGASMDAMLNIAPRQLAAEQEYLPQYTQLTNDATSQAVLGNNGILDMLQGAAPRVNALNTGQRAAAINDVSTLGPGVMSAWRTANPQLAALLDAVTSNAGSELGYGSTMSPDMQHTLAQSVRTAQAARGMGTGRGDAGLEAYYTAQQGNNLLQQRLANARSAAQLTAGVTPDIFSTILGSTQALTPQSAVTAGNNVVGSSRPRLFDPFSQYAAQLYGQNYQGQLSATETSSNNEAAILNAGIGAQKGGSVSAGSGVSTFF